MYVGFKLGLAGSYRPFISYLDLSVRYHCEGPDTLVVRVSATAVGAAAGHSVLAPCQNRCQE